MTGSRPRFSFIECTGADVLDLRQNPERPAYVQLFYHIKSEVIDVLVNAHLG